MWTQKVARRAVGLAVGFLLLACGMAVAGHAWNAEDDKQALLTLEDRWLASENNPEALKSILADDFVHALPIGFITKAEQIDYVARMKNADTGKKHFEDMHVRVYAGVGIVNGIVVNETGKDVQKTVFTDVFAKRNGKWQAVNAQEVPFRQRPAA